MSTTDSNAEQGAPATAEEIICNLRNSLVKTDEDASYRTSSVGAKNTASLSNGPASGLRIRRDHVEEYDLDPKVTAWYSSRGDDVALSIESKNNDGVGVEAAADLTPDAARELALQLLTSAAVADKDSEPKAQPATPDGGAQPEEAR